jgi:thiol-disulfide isomerase/thioredoxin
VRRRLISLGIGCVLAGLLAVGLFGPWGTSQTASVKLPASIPALDGTGRVALPKLGSDLPAPVVMTFFASWCGPCETEVPALAKFVRTEQADGAKVSFIGVDENDQTGGRAFAKKVGVDFPVGSDIYGTVLEALGAEPALPQTIFINTKGKIVYHKFGSVTSGSTLQTWVRKITAT